MAKSIIKIPCPLCNIWQRYYQLYFKNRDCWTCGNTKMIRVNMVIRNKKTKKPIIIVVGCSDKRRNPPNGDSKGIENTTNEIKDAE